MPSIATLLVANRGEIAARIFRSARDVGIRTVAVFSDADVRLPFVALADDAVRLPGNAPTDTYLRADLLVDAAHRARADAIHPGYGFLAENAAFARRCEDAGIVFVGPPSSVIEAMGSKVEAKRVMSAAGVPVLPSVVVGAKFTDAALARTAGDVGYPLLVKAVFGGGGRGMRVVRSPSDLSHAVESAQREAASAFGDGTVFLERLVERPRHVEVQVVGDHHGTVVHLFERECSIQRRHQKIIEEAPSPALDDAQRAALCDAAVAAAKAIGYVNAGTVEFVLDPSGDFFFLEVNTRLQVEHPVTEMVTGLDLVALQLAIAEGHPVPAEARAATISGHAIEARLYAEDVSAGYVPLSGPLHRFRIPVAVGVRIDRGYEDGSVVSTFYDALLAKVIAWAPTRDMAAGRLARVLRDAQLHGPVTNRDLLVRVLEHADFLAGRTDTEFLDRLSLAAGDAHDREVDERHAIAAAIAARSERQASSPLPPGIPPAWRNVGPAAQPVVYEGKDGAPIPIELASPNHPIGGLASQVRVGERALDVVVHAGDAAAVDLELDGERRQYSVQRVDDVVYVDSSRGASALRIVERFPVPDVVVAAGSLLAPLPGNVVRVRVTVGQRVAAGDVLVVLEAMKMEHTIRAAFDGTVKTVEVAVGDQVDTGAVLVVVEPEPGSS